MSAAIGICVPGCCCSVASKDGLAISESDLIVDTNREKALDHFWQIEYTVGSKSRPK
jgi:hypothetical protein